jgi:hypothetical protein
VLAYTFWHWPKPSIARVEYEARVARFHRVLAAHPSSGFVRSYALAIEGAPWANGGAPAYDDWYLVDGSAALDPLNEAAITAQRQFPHDEAAAAAAGGIAGLYRMRRGKATTPPSRASWFAKPTGMSYQDLLAVLYPLVDRTDGALWGRQMTLGPTPEFCLHTSTDADVPPPLTALAVRMRSVGLG